jgi:cytochrome oxidase Cu insertion factor (SCO1/SenC/PrrC family)
MFPKRSILALVALAAACDSPSGPSAPLPRSGAAPTRRAPAPDFTLTDIDGKPWSLSSLRGKPVVLSFWFLG